MLCEAFTDVNKFFLTDQELLVEQKISQLYIDIENVLMKEECDTVEKLNEVILNQKTNYRAQAMIEYREPVNIKYLMEGVRLNKDIGPETDQNNNEVGIENALKLEYVRENL